MDHLLARGRFESRNVSMCNCSTIRSPWAESCYKRTLPVGFQGSFPFPVEYRCPWSLVDAVGTSNLCLGWGQMPALVCSQDPGLFMAPSRSCPEHTASLCSISMLLPAETWAGKRQHLSDFPSITQLQSSQASLTQGIRSASGFTSLDRPQDCSTAIVWFDHESHPSLGSKHTSHALPLFASHIKVLSTASLWCFLTFQKQWPSSNQPFSPSRVVTCNLRQIGKWGTVGRQELGIACLLLENSLHWWCAALGCF